LNYKDVRTLLISPHQDDIALSLGGSILAGFFARPILVLNVFTISSYAPQYSGNRDEANVTRIRATEDDQFARHLGLIHVDLGLKDALLRWKLHQDTFPLLSASSLTRGWPPPNSIPAKKLSRRFTKVPITLKAAILQKIAYFDRIYMIVKNEISEMISECENAIVAAPLSLASQPDHVIVANGCHEINSNSSKVLYYEDLPYAWRYKPRDIPKHVNHFDKHLVPHLINIDDVFEEKLKNLDAYHSQLDQSEIEAVVEHAKRLDPSGIFERLWIRKN
jgi:LmbE family N-acetylglucosaminyl deacetylase